MLWTYVIWMRIRNHLCPESRKKLSSKTEGTGSDTCAHLKLQGSSVPGGARSPPAEARRQRTSAGRTASSHLRCRRRHGTVRETEGIWHSWRQQGAEESRSRDSRGQPRPGHSSSLTQRSGQTTLNMLIVLSLIFLKLTFLFNTLERFSWNFI